MVSEDSTSRVNEETWALSMVSEDSTSRVEKESGHCQYYQRTQLQELRRRVDVVDGIGRLDLQSRHEESGRCQWYRPPEWRRRVSVVDGIRRLNIQSQ
jgi:hypothetical protein